MNYYKKGFTLIEITVVTTIIILLSSFFFANYRGGEKVFNLKRSSHQVSQVLRRAEELALSSKEVSITRQSVATLPKGGYGIYFDKNNNGKYILFADCDGDKIFDSNGSAIDCKDATLELSLNETIEEFDLEKCVTIDRIVAGDQDNVEKLYITFFPPDPIIEILYDEVTDPVNTAMILLKCENQTKNIYINKVGLIDIY